MCFFSILLNLKRFCKFKDRIWMFTEYFNVIEIQAALVICDFAYMRSWNGLFSGTYRLIYSHPWSFYMQICYMRAYFFESLSLAYNEVHLYILFKYMTFEMDYLSIVFHYSEPLVHNPHNRIILLKLPRKMVLTSKVIKIDSKVKILLCSSNSVLHSMCMISFSIFVSDWIMLSIKHEVIMESLYSFRNQSYKRNLALKFFN